MNNKNNISEKWIKASIIGTIWAASEIVLGSFFHNLKIPFTSNILTGIAIVILISISYKWTDRGLFWRAGLICAVMKTMSPSAVIFGPMIAIFSEAVLLDISIRLFGRSILGFVLGGILAMSWNLFQKIINYIIFYGSNIIEIYKNLLKFAQKQLNIQFDIVWLPILLLLLIYIILGIISAIIGIKVGRKVLLQPKKQLNPKTGKNNILLQNKIKSEFNYSLTWLFSNILLIVVSLISLNFDILYWSIFITIVVAIWVFRYKRAMRQLLRPKFWIFFIVITMLTAFVFTKLQSKTLYDGLLIGLQMNFRAIIIILGFSVLGTELYNPRIRTFFMKTYFKQLPLALELSFESLPVMVANIPDIKTIIRNPVSVLHQLISEAEQKFDKYKNDISQKVFIISGAVDEGKTTAIRKLIDVFKENNIKSAGIYSLKIIENNLIVGYDIVDIITGAKTPFLRLGNSEYTDRIGKFEIINEGIKAGQQALYLAETSDFEIVVIDEVGLLETEGKAWSDNITHLIKLSKVNLILTVRNTNVEKVLQKWNFKAYYELNLSKSDFDNIKNFIVDKIIIDKDK